MERINDFEMEGIRDESTQKSEAISDETSSTIKSLVDSAQFRLTPPTIEEAEIKPTPNKDFILNKLIREFPRHEELIRHSIRYVREIRSPSYHLHESGWHIYSFASYFGFTKTNPRRNLTK